MNKYFLFSKSQGMNPIGLLIFIFTTQVGEWVFFYSPRRLDLTAVELTKCITDDEILSEKKTDFLIISIIVIYEAFCLDVAQGHMNGAPNKTRTLSCRFAS